MPRFSICPTQRGGSKRIGRKAYADLEGCAESSETEKVGQDQFGEDGGQDILGKGLEVG